MRKLALARAAASWLPQTLNSFVGRKRDVAELDQLVETTRLLTLLGAGGIGKTRFALRVAQRIGDSDPGAVEFVDLSPVHDPALVVHAVAARVNVRGEPGRPLPETLARMLPPRALLLVLDNCEHVVTACAELADLLLRACRGIRILATSREPLSVPGEVTWVVEPLEPASAEQLFVDRARAAQPRMQLSDDVRSAVADVCRRLDGIPLAIELAAARTRVLSVQQIAARLDDRFRS